MRRAFQPPPSLGSGHSLVAAAEGGVDVARFFLVLAAILVAAKLLGELAERIGQPAVLGELLAGVLLGGSVLGVVPDRRSRGRADPCARRARRGAAPVRDRSGDRPAGDVPGRARRRSRWRWSGIVLPFAFGYLFWRYAPHAASGSGDLVTAAIFIGATLTATSVGITARVLSDLGR